MRSKVITEDEDSFEIPGVERGITLSYTRPNGRWLSVVFRVPVCMVDGEVQDRPALLHLLYDTEHGRWANVEFVPEQ